MTSHSLKIVLQLYLYIVKKKLMNLFDTECTETGVDQMKPTGFDVTIQHT